MAFNGSTDVSFLSSNKLSFKGKGEKWNSAADTAAYAKQIEEADNLVVLELSGNSLGIDGSKPIAEALKKHPEIKQALWSDLFTGRLNSEIPIVLKTLTDSLVFAKARLTVLNLADNAIGPQAIGGLQDFLTGEGSFGLRELNLNNCGLGYAGEIVANCLIQCHRNALCTGTLVELKTFIAGRNRLENRGAFALSKAFKVFRSLVEVRMPQNGIRPEGIAALAEGLAPCANLQVLDLNDNTFSRHGAVAMAKMLSKKSKLRFLDFGDCLCRRYGSLDIVTALTNAASPIETLNLTGNEIDGPTVDRIIELSYLLKSLKTLILFNNTIGDNFEEISNRYSSVTYVNLGTESEDEGSRTSDTEDELDVSSAAEEESKEEEALMAAFGDVKICAPEPPAPTGVPQLVSFKGQGRKLNNAADTQDIAIAIHQCTNLEALELSGNSLGIEGSQPIADALKRHPEIQRALWSDLFTGRLNSEIPSILKTLTDSLVFAKARLTVLNLADNAIGPQAIGGLQDFLTGEGSFGLRELNLNNCGLGYAGEIVANCLIACHEKAQSLGTSAQLSTFIAGRNRLENRGAFALAKAFSVYKTLVEVRMPQNGIRREGIAALAEGLESCSDLEVLDLNDNTFSRQGAAAMGNMLVEKSKLRYLDFGDCLCRRYGSMCVVTALVSAKSPVEFLNLNGNEIDGPTVDKIIDLSKSLRGLKNLSLLNNTIGDGFDEVAERYSGLSFVNLGTESDDEGSRTSDTEDDEPED